MAVLGGHTKPLCEGDIEAETCMSRGSQAWKGPGEERQMRTPVMEGGGTAEEQEKASVAVTDEQEGGGVGKENRILTGKGITEAEDSSTFHSPGDSVDLWAIPGLCLLR